MLRLNISKEPYWLNLPGGVEVKVKPLSTGLMNAAQAWALQRVQEMQVARKKVLDTGASISNFPEIEKDHIRASYSETMVMKGVAVNSITEWKGVYLPEKVDDKDVLAPCTEEYICSLMEEWLYSNAFWDHITKQMIGIYNEGNFLSPVVNGILAMGLDNNTAQDAEKKDSPVQKEKKE